MLRSPGSGYLFSAAKVSIGPAADDLANLLERRGRREPLRHDGGDDASRPGEGFRQMRKWPFQTEPHGAVVGGRQLLGRGHQRIGQVDARGKAADAGDNIARQHRLLVVKAQPVAQCQRPSQPVLLDLMTLDHLRLGRPARIDAIERIEDEIGVGAPRSWTGEVWVEHAEILGRNKDQLAGLLRPPDPRRRKRGNTRAAGFEQISSKHDNLPLSYCWFILFEIVSRIYLISAVHSR